MDDLVDASKIAEIFGVTIQTVQTWTRQGRIPCIRPTQMTVRYRLADVERALTCPATSSGRQHPVPADGGAIQ